VSDGGPSADEERVHEIRVSIKRARSILRLVRLVIADRAYRTTMDVLRDAAHLLSTARDAEVALQIAATLGRSRPRSLPGLSRVRVLLERERDASEGRQQREAGRSQRQLVRTLERAARRARRLDLSGRGWERLRPGLWRAYRKARGCFEEIDRASADEVVHAWRKRVKDLGYIARALGQVLPRTLGSREPDLDRLGKLLGEHHDLAALRTSLVARRRTLGGIRTLASWLTAIDRRQSLIHRRALGLGERVFAPSPHAMVEAMEREWRRGK
jgi:CHAD domain-containing protein